MRNYGNEIREEILKKGWKLKEVAHLWGVSPRQMSNIMKNPRPIHWWAAKGLPIVWKEEEDSPPV